MLHTVTKYRLSLSLFSINKLGQQNKTTCSKFCCPSLGRTKGCTAFDYWTRNVIHYNFLLQCISNKLGHKNACSLLFVVNPRRIMYCRRNHIETLAHSRQNSMPSLLIFDPFLKLLRHRRKRLAFRPCFDLLHTSTYAVGPIRWVQDVRITVSFRHIQTIRIIAISMPV